MKIKDMIPSLQKTLNDENNYSNCIILVTKVKSILGGEVEHRKTILYTDLFKYKELNVVMFKMRDYELYIYVESEV